jgi:hypothetical protein
MKGLSLVCLGTFTTAGSEAYRGIMRVASARLAVYLIGVCFLLLLEPWWSRYGVNFYNRGGRHFWPGSLVVGFVLQTGTGPRFLNGFTGCKRDWLEDFFLYVDVPTRYRAFPVTEELLKPCESSPLVH